MSICWEKKRLNVCKPVNMDDIVSEFTCLKVSALSKVSRISAMGEMNSTAESQNKTDSDKLENIENEQNLCNIKTPQKTNASTRLNMSSSNGIYFSINKIHVENELQRKENVRKEIRRHVEQMEQNDRAIQEHMANMRSAMARERERRSAEKLAHILAEEERIAEQEEIKRRHEQQLQAQRAQERKEEVERKVREYLKQKETEEMINTVVMNRNKFLSKYCDIAKLCKTCKDEDSFNAVLAPNTARIQELVQQLQTLQDKLESEELEATDVNLSEIILIAINEELNIFQTEIEKINIQYEAELMQKAQIANEVHPVAEIQSVPASDAASSQQSVVIDVAEPKDTKEQISGALINQEAAVATSYNEIVVPSIPDSRPSVTPKASECKKESLSEYVDKESLQIYLKSRQILDRYKSAHKDFLQSADTKKFRFECQKAINIPVNAISGVSEQHLRDKYDRLQNFLTGKSSPNVTQHPQGVTYCKDHLAKKLVSQGETLVSSKPEMAFPVAMIVIALWNEHADFGDLFLAHLHEACPFIVPIFPQQQEGQSNEDYYKSLGCKYSEDGTVETQDKFLKRMSGLMRLYASITVTRQLKGVTRTHPHGLQHAWRWLAVVLNIAPRVDICNLCATLILDMLEVAGNLLWNSYPTQFRKLLTLLKEQYYPEMRRVVGDGGGPLMRLEEFLNNALAHGAIRPADGMLPPNFL